MTSRVRSVLAEFRYGFTRAVPAIGILIALNGLPLAGRPMPSKAHPGSVRTAPAAQAKAAAAASPSISDSISDSDAARFLEQATFGPTPADIQHVQDIGFDAWLDEQFSMPLSNFPDTATCPTTSGLCPDSRPGNCTGNCQRDNYSVYPLTVNFFQNALTAPNQLRQRVAFALNQIMVISAQDGTLNMPSRMEPYLEVLDADAFGNFRDLLYDITLNPGMGRYLDMVNNSKTAPNENYAREIMQLFSIGLNKLNDDGTPILDDQGNLEATYTQDTITNLARVFTGWTFEVQPEPGVTNYVDPMRVRTPENNFHDTDAKVLLDTCDPLPAGLNTVDDLNAGLDCIFNSPYVGPYIGKNLIQHLVTSNPSPDYVARVTAAFNDNGNGVRGDMQAVIRAILEDPEARGDAAPDGNFGHLREPILWITSLLRALGTTSDTTDFVLADSYLDSALRMDQDVFRSPTVFNFFPPDYVIPGETLLGPEFEIQSTATSLARVNFACSVIFHGAAPYPSCNIPPSANRPTGTWIDENTLLSLPTDDPQQLVDTLNDQMMHGSMTMDMNSRIVSAVSDISDPDPIVQALKRAREAVYLIATSSQYNTER